MPGRLHVQLAVSCDLDCRRNSQKNGVTHRVMADAGNPNIQANLGSSGGMLQASSRSRKAHGSGTRPRVKRSCRRYRRYARGNARMMAPVHDRSGIIVRRTTPGLVCDGQAARQMCSINVCQSVRYTSRPGRFIQHEHVIKVNEPGEA